MDKTIHPTHQMGDWHTDIRAPAGTPRFYSVRECTLCGAEELQHPAGHFYGDLDELLIPCEALETSLRELPIQLYDIVIDITVGEYEHDEHLYYYGTQEDAERYGRAYMTDIWGAGETEYDPEQGWMSKPGGERGAVLAGVYPLDWLPCMTDKGALHIKIVPNGIA